MSDRKKHYFTVLKNSSLSKNTLQRADKPSRKNPRLLLQKKKIFEERRCSKSLSLPVALFQSEALFTLSQKFNC